MNISELKELQKKIIAINKKYNKIALIGLIVILIIGIVTTILLSKYFMIAMFVLPSFLWPLMIFEVTIAIIKAKKTSEDSKTFKKEYKRIFILNALEKEFTDVTYKPEKGFPEEFIENTHMMTTGDSYESNDYIEAKYKNVNFSQSDIHIREKHETTDSDGNKKTHWVTVFQGRWLVFDFNKEFKANVQVATHGFPSAQYYGGENFKKVKMEESAFNNIFSVYTQNEHDAFYILTPHFMEKLKKIKEELNISIMFCFIDNKLHIALNNYKDTFEPNVLKEINETEEQEKPLKDIRTITNLIDELRLDNDLFRKEV